MRNNKYQSGFIAFSSLLIISVVTLAISISISLLGVGEAKSSLDFRKGEDAFKKAESCVEEALLRLRENSSYTNGSLTFDNGTCTINVTGAGNTRTINAEGTVTGPPIAVKRIQAQVLRSGRSITLTSWNEVETF